MKERSKASEFSQELEDDLARIMLVERRHAEKIGSRQARDLILKIKNALTEERDEAQDLMNGFPVH